MLHVDTETVFDTKAVASGLFHSAMLTVLLLGIIDSVPSDLIHNAHSIYLTYLKEFTPLFTWEQCAYTVRLISNWPSSFDYWYSAVTSQSSRNRIVLAAITILYLCNVFEGYTRWMAIDILIGTSGENILSALLAGSVPYSSNPVLQDIANNVPLVIADGLLVRSL